MRPKTWSWNPWTLYLHFHPAWDTIGLEVYTNQWVVVESQAEVVHSCWLWGRKSLAYVGGIGLDNFWYGWYEPSYAPQFQSGILHQARTLDYLFTYHCISESDAESPSIPMQFEFRCLYMSSLSKTSSSSIFGKGWVTLISNVVPSPLDRRQCDNISGQSSVSLVSCRQTFWRESAYMRLLSASSLHLWSS